MRQFMRQRAYVEILTTREVWVSALQTSLAPFLGFKNSSPREKLGSSSSSTGWLVAILS